ncbi:MAG: hypothetical protein JXX14_12370 [Deltaproteobacteria bacterium]|nr:hypothetical protein [Deltaproteobacteria bacterium]
MTHPKLKIAGSLLAVALGVVLGWLTLEWLLDALEGDDVRLAANHLGQKLWIQLKFALLSALVGGSVFWGSIVGRRWNLPVRLLLLSIFAIGVQWTTAAIWWIQISAAAPDGTEDVPAVIFLGSLGTDWIPLLTAAIVWVAVVPLLFGARKPDPLNDIPPVLPHGADAQGIKRLSETEDNPSVER